MSMVTFTELGDIHRIGRNRFAARARPVMSTCSGVSNTYVLICGSSWRTTFNNELWTSMPPL
jgi:hypothetical protein